MQATHADAASFESGRKGNDSANVTKTDELKLPDIALSDLPESTKDYIIAYSATGKSVTDAIKDTLNQAAAAAGFSPNPKAA